MFLLGTKNDFKQECHTSPNDSLYVEAFIAEIRRQGELAGAYYHSAIRMSLDLKFKISNFIAS